MYDSYYNFSGLPFQLTPDARFFFGAKAHTRAIAHLTFGMSQGEGFIIITGEVGAGKTTLVERLCTQIDRDAYTLARINTTQVSGDDLFRLAMAGFGVTETAGEKSTLLLRFEAMLRDQRDAGRRCLLIVDEAQNLSVPALEELRMLSNITDGGPPTLQTLLLGQPQFRTMLASSALDQLRQRVLASFHLGPLTRDETRAYIEHRLRAVDWQDHPHWEDGAFEAVFDASDGIPRRINRLCSRTLLFGALEESDRVTRDMVEATAKELESDLVGDRADPEPMELHDEPMLVGVQERLTALEMKFARREYTFQRLMTLLTSRGI